MPQSKRHMHTQTPSNMGGGTRHNLTSSTYTRKHIVASPPGQRDPVVPSAWVFPFARSYSPPGQRARIENMSDLISEYARIKALEGPVPIKWSSVYTKNESSDWIFVSEIETCSLCFFCSSSICFCRSASCDHSHVWSYSRGNQVVREDDTHGDR